MDMKRVKELARIQEGKDTWDLEILGELCYYADLEEEWENAGEDFESVAYKAAEILGVEIV